MTARFCPLSVRIFAVGCLSLSLVVPASAAKKGAIRRLTLDPDAPVVKLFDGIDKGVFEVRVSARNEFDAKVFLTNKTDKPKTVSLPKAAVAVHVLKQFLPPGNPGQNPFGFGDGAQRGRGQEIGGPFGPNGNANFPNVGNPNLLGNFFSIPPGKTVQIQMRSVCLQHGKPAPSPKKKYVLRRLEEHTSNRALRRLLEDYDPQKTDRMALQAAAWHLANDMSFVELKAKKRRRLGGHRGEPYFTWAQIEKAESLVEAAKKNAGKDAPSPGVATKKL